MPTSDRAARSPSSPKYAADESSKPSVDEDLKSPLSSNSFLSASEYHDAQETFSISDGATSPRTSASLDKQQQQQQQQQDPTINIDIHSYQFLARKALGGFLNRLTEVIFENAFVIQGNAPDELPEVVLASARGYRVDFMRNRPLRSYIAQPQHGGRAGVSGAGAAGAAAGGGVASTGGAGAGAAETAEAAAAGGEGTQTATEAGGGKGTAAGGEAAAAGAPGGACMLSVVTGRTHLLGQKSSYFSLRRLKPSRTPPGYSSTASPAAAVQYDRRYMAVGVTRTAPKDWNMLPMKEGGSPSSSPPPPPPRPLAPALLSAAPPEWAGAASCGPSGSGPPGGWKRPGCARPRMSTPRSASISSTITDLNGQGGAGGGR
ncbi:hypothetical protein TSOC_003257 [Tetrabaena socialis]|uniref:Protein ENHANCED DISEASE RESISTANCE 2 C-terminal domain-containing protein n=1 Tax=Tetrabaena socialis TaxID=47790 RepID=A0A2J8AC14_9CHLO|nr:hypothetical protein TSOC_003257 [Tetrabaena socialis]|eukprot:PNH10060.1 hypothetical protein TSOC_003257 [Tetrabaena socialis]